MHAALEFHSCSALAVGPAVVWGGRRWLSAFSRVKGLITQVMSPCKLVSVTAVHRHVVVDIHALVVNFLQNNNNNYTIWGGSVFNRRGASTPLWGVEACSHPSRRPNPIPAIPPYVVRTPHLHGAPTTEETVKL